MNRNNTLSLFFFIAMFISSQVAWAGEIDTRGLAILQHVADARANPKAFTVEFELQVNRDYRRWYDVSINGEQLRVEIFTESSKNLGCRETVVLQDESWLWVYHDGRYNSLERQHLGSPKLKSQNIISPESIGLVTVNGLYNDLVNLLYEDADAITITGESNKRGEPTVMIEVDRYNVVSRFEIASDSGRVYWRANFLDFKAGEEIKLHSTMEASFSRDPAVSWAPSEVKLHQETTQRSESLKNIHFDPIPPEPEVFELYSLGIPNETTIVDNDQMLQIGTWNGNRVVRPTDNRSGVPDQSNWGYYVLLGLMTAGVLGVCWFIRHRMRRNSV